MFALIIAPALAAAPASQPGDGASDGASNFRIQSIEPFEYAYVSKRTTLDTLQDAIASLMPQLDKALDAGQLRQMGNVVFTYHDVGPKRDQPFMLDIGVQVKDGSTVPPEFKSIAVPQSRCATALHFGPASGLPRTYMQLFGELARRGLRQTSICREVYLVWNGPKSENNIIQIQVELQADSSDSNSTKSDSTKSDATKTAAVKLDGGYESDPRDRGRPVVLVAGGLKISPEVFREAFTHVKPAGPDRGPTEDEARKNKDALLGALSKYGVTNDRLDEVSNFYRYRRESGDLWQHHAAKVTANVRDGKVVRFTIDDAGYGYTSPPTLSVDGVDEVKATIKLHFDTDLKRNGSIESIEMN